MLVSFPPLTYMLKFSGCSYLRSDCEEGVAGVRSRRISRPRSPTRECRTHNTRQGRKAASWSQTRSPSRRSGRSEPNNELRRWRSSQTRQQIPIQICIKISLMHRMRSKSCRFSEFRTSQCVSQFAAFFLDPRTKAFTVANIMIGRYALIGQLKSS